MISDFDLIWIGFYFDSEVVKKGLRNSIMKVLGLLVIIIKHFCQQKVYSNQTLIVRFIEAADEMKEKSGLHDFFFETTGPLIIFFFFEIWVLS